MFVVYTLWIFPYIRMCRCERFKKKKLEVMFGGVHRFILNFLSNVYMCLLMLCVFHVFVVYVCVCVCFIQHGDIYVCCVHIMDISIYSYVSL